MNIMPHQDSTLTPEVTVDSGKKYLDPILNNFNKSNTANVSHAGINGNLNLVNINVNVNMSESSHMPKKERDLL